MTSKCQVLAPVIIDGKIVTSGIVYLPDDIAAEHDKAGRVDTIEIDGVLVQWPGCCDGNHGH